MILIINETAVLEKFPEIELATDLIRWLSVFLAVIGRGQTPQKVTIH